MTHKDQPAMTGAPYMQWIPEDSSVQVSAHQLVGRVLAEMSSRGILNVLDVGCGRGDSRARLARSCFNMQWFGLDIMTSGEARTRTESRLRMAYYDGAQFPFASDVFNIVFCRQVFEHVAHPQAVMNEIQRVLSPAGVLVLSTSFLEPYHSESMWGFSPLGLAMVAQRSGLEILEIRPGIDGMTLIIRRLLGQPSFFTRWFERESPLNTLISLIGVLRRVGHRKINARKLQCCGHICLMARKSETQGDTIFSDCTGGKE